MIPEDTVRSELFREVLDRFGRARLRVSGTSMVPAIWPGDIVEVVRAEAATLAAGDVILFQQDGRLICHRIEGWASASVLRTRGDHLPASDPALHVSSVLGRVVDRGGKQRLAGAVLRALSFVSERPIAWLVRAMAHD